MKCKVQLTYRSGRNVTVESDEYEHVGHMVRDMAHSSWYFHAAGAENMMEVERIKPLSGMTVTDPRRVT